MEIWVPSEVVLPAPVFWLIIASAVLTAAGTVWRKLLSPVINVLNESLLLLRDIRDFLHDELPKMLDSEEAQNKSIAEHELRIVRLEGCAEEYSLARSED